MLRPSRGQSGGRTVRRAGGRLDFGLRRGLHAKVQSLSVAIVRYGVRVGRFGAARGIWFNLLDLCRNQIRRQANPRDLHPCSHLFHPTQPHPTPARNTTPLEPTSPTPTPRHSTLHTHTHTHTHAPTQPHTTIATATATPSLPSHPLPSPRCPSPRRFRRGVCGRQIGSTPRRATGYQRNYNQLDITSLTSTAPTSISSSGPSALSGTTT